MEVRNPWNQYFYRGSKFPFQFCRAVYAIATDVKSNIMDSLDTSQPVYGGVGHDFNYSPQVQDDKKVCLAYI